MLVELALVNRAFVAVKLVINAVTAERTFAKRDVEVPLSAKRLVI